MRKTSLLLPLSLILFTALAPGLLRAQRHPMPPDLKLASGIDMRGGPLRRASRVEADLVKVGSDSFTSLADITAPVYAAMVAATNATLTAANSYADGVGTAANSYADAATNVVLMTANSYADEVGTAAGGYADAAINATLAAANSYADAVPLSVLRLFTDGTNLFFVTGASVTNTVTIKPVE